MSPSPSPITLVTGANRSIGLEIARTLAKRGHTVLLGSRNTALGADAATALAEEGIHVDVVHIDLNDSATHAEAASTIRERFGRLDVLVNNAAVLEAGDGAAGVVDLDAIRRTFDTNVVGTLSLTRALLPLMKQARAGRIINLSSALGSIGEAADAASEFSSVRLAAYAISKTALNMLTVQLAAELKADGIDVNAVDPGFTATDMNGHQGYQSVAEGAAEAVRLATCEPGPTGGFFATGRTMPW